MLRALSPGNEAYNYLNLYQKKGQISLKNNSRNIPPLPYIKKTRDQTTTTDEIKTSSINNTNIKINPNIMQQEIQFIKNKYVFNGIDSIGKIQDNDSLNNINMKKYISNNNINLSAININQNKNTKIFFNKNYKLKSIEKTMIKSNSSVNIINKKQTLTIINIPSAKLNKNINYLNNYKKDLKRSSSLPKINFENKNDIKNNDNENNKCNYLNLKYNGLDNSKNELKKKKLMVINSHKVMESLQSISMPDDNYGQKLIDILENRINSGYYRNIKLNLGQSSENSKLYKDYLNSMNKYNNENKENNKIENKKKRFSSTFLTDVYDDFLLPDKDNKYNYTIHKIFLSNILNKIYKKMIEIRDVKNKLITKKEIRDEFCNELNILRNNLYKNKNINIINNNIYNINSNTNIISIDLSNNNSIINEISTVEELPENSFNEIHTTNDEKDKDKQYLTSNMFNLVNNNNQLVDNYNINNYINIDNDNNNHYLESLHSKYKNISTNENKKLLTLIKDKLKIKNKEMTLHDTCSNVYINKPNKETDINKAKDIKIKNIVKSNLHKNKYLSSLTENYYSDEEKLNNVDKFLLNTKKLRYTFKAYEKTPKNERNHSYDLEGNIHHSFNVGPKLNIYDFEDIFDEIQHQYDLNNNIYTNNSKIQIIKEIMHYFFNKKNSINKLKFNNHIVQKFLSMILPYKYLIKKDKKNKKKNRNKSKRKKTKNIIAEISKKIHKKIKLKGGRLINTDLKLSKLKKHYHTADNIKGSRRAYYLTENSVKNNDILFTDNIYLEIETNSSEYTDVPSELDSDIEEMIRKKKEKEKDKELEEGIYSQKKEEKSKGGDFIINNPKDKDKEKEKIKNLKQNSINNNKVNDQINNNINLIKDDSRPKLPEENLDNISTIYLNSNIDKYLQKNEVDDINKSKNFKGNKNFIRANTLRQSKANMSNSININQKKRKSGIIDINLILDNKYKNKKDDNIKKSNISTNTTSSKDNDKNINDDKKKIKNIDIKNLHLKKNTNILENILEEESKETKRIRPEREVKKKKTTRKKTRRHKATNRKDKKDRKDIKINADTNNRNSSSAEVTSDYEAYSLNNDILSDNKSNNLHISPKYNDDNLKESVVNNQNTEEKSKQKSNISKKEEKEEASSEEKKNDKKNNSFCGKRPLLFTEEVEDEEKEEKILYKTFSYLNTYRNKLNRIMYLNKTKNNILDGYEENENTEEKENEEEEEENIGKRKRIKRKKKTINIKGVKGLFMDNNNEEIKTMEYKESETEEIEEIEEIPKLTGWEAKFELFKQYIKDLKDMNNEQFNYEAMKYLKENEKDDFAGKSKLSQVERINNYKSFLIKAKNKSINYKKYISPNIIFTPGCIFNTGELCK